MICMIAPIFILCPPPPMNCSPTLAPHGNECFMFEFTHVPWCTAAPLCKEGECTSNSAWMTKGGDGRLPLTFFFSFFFLFEPAELLQPFYPGWFHVTLRVVTLIAAWMKHARCLYENMTGCALLMNSLPSTHKNREPKLWMIGGLGLFYASLSGIADVQFFTLHFFKTALFLEPSWLLFLPLGCWGC